MNSISSGNQISGLNSWGTIAEMTQRWKQLGRSPALQIPSGPQMNVVTYEELLTLPPRLAHLITTLNPKVQNIAILSESRPEWVLLLFASFFAGRLLFVLDPQLSDQEIAKQLAANGCELLIYSRRNAARRHKLGQIIHQLELEDLVSSMHSTRDYLALDWTSLDLNRSFLIVQGSGTTGGNKSIMISFNNLLYESDAIHRRMGLNQTDRTLSILPINHLFELTAGTLGPLFSGACVTFANTLLPHEIIRLMNEQRITILPAVPLFFKAMKRSIELTIAKSSFFSRTMFALITRVTGYLPIKIVRTLLPAHKKLGGHLRFFVSGGAALPQSIEQFFQRIGLDIRQGYGLSEASPVVTANGESCYRAGSCGQALPGTDIKIINADALGIGELCFRGPQMMQGYWRDPEATAKVMTSDGWFKTGDLGRIDAQGFLFLTGRSRNLIALGGGKKIFPEEVESLLSEMTTAKEAVVLGLKTDDWEEVALLCVPQDELWIEHQHDLEQLRSLVAADVRHQLADVADYKKPSRIFLTREPLPKTSTHKVRLNLVREMISQGKCL